MTRMVRLSIYIAALLFSIWLVVPTTDIVSPDWDVQITDLSGSPIEGSSVTDFSQQYTLETTSRDDTKMTGFDGRVHFNVRKIRANGLMRILGAFRNLDQGVHASFGVHTSLHAFKPGYGDPMLMKFFGPNNQDSTASGAPHQSSRIRLQKCDDGYSGIGCAFPNDPSKPVLPFRPK